MRRQVYGQPGTPGSFDFATAPLREPVAPRRMTNILWR